MAGHAHDPAAEKHGAAHSDSYYVKIWAILLVLLVISIAGPEVAHVFPPSYAKVIVLITAFGIAFVKAWLVVKHFMHLMDERPVVRYMLVTCLVFMGLFFAAVSPDVLRHTGRNWSNLAAADAIARAQAEQAERAKIAAEEGAAHGVVPVDTPIDVRQSPAVPPEPNYAELTDPNAQTEWLMTLGTKIYMQGVAQAPGSACVMCHGQQGSGLPGLSEPFAGAASLQSCEAAARVTVHGVVGEIPVDGVPRKAVMPAFARLNDEQVAAISTFVRRTFGDFDGVCAPADVAGVR